MKYWDTIYKELGIVQKEPSEMVVKAINFFKKNNVNTILDLGCGTARHSLFLLKNNFKVYGCDCSENALNIAKKIKEIEFKKCDMTSLPYDDGFFDAVLCNFVIQHGKIVDVEKTISGIYRILRKDGLLFLTVPSTQHDEFLTGEVIEPNTKINIDAIDGDMPHHYFVEEEMKVFFKKFDILKLNHFKAKSEKNQNKDAAGWELYAKKF